jgi:pimeloyl-ACP methyl ester carboxylesterase
MMGSARSSLAFVLMALCSRNSTAQTAVRDTLIHFTSGSMTLEGTLVMPAGTGPFPAAVIIAGSGPTDRNGNAPGGISTDTYAMLASSLAERGIASLRYDKRGLPTSKGTFEMAATTLADFAADAASAARYLDSRPDIGAITLIGHSEGGTLAMLATRDGAPVRALVLIATAGRDPTVILREQLGRQLPPALLASFDTAWRVYVHTDSAVTAPPGLEALFVPVNRAFLKSWQAIDPVALLRGLQVPTLIVQGETDVQITPADARLLGTARSDIRVEVLPGVNHVLKEATGSTPQEQIAAYTNRALPLAPSVMPLVSRFILDLRP